jgi:hypothetical protein
VVSRKSGTGTAGFVANTAALAVMERVRRLRRDSFVIALVPLVSVLALRAPGG